ncbi:MAG: glycosyltransferase family 4 protein [Candidatus Bathyarchaeia archaeon]
MKICAVSQSFFPHTGGVSYYLLWLGRKCRELNHELCVIHLKPAKAPPEEVVESIKVYRVPKTSLDSRILSGYTQFKELILKIFHGGELSEDKLINKHLYGFNDYFTINKFFSGQVREVYEKEHFDLLHVHDFQLLPLGSLLNDLTVPKIFTWHIPYTDKPSPQWRKFVVQYMTHYDRVVFSTRPYVAVAIQDGLSWDKAVCISPFVTVERVKGDFRSNYGIKPDERVILCVARIDPLKGQDRLIKALPIILKEIPNVRCVFVGDGSMTKEILKAEGKRRYEEELKSLVAELKLEAHVIFTGHISRRDLMTAYAAADVVVLPSIMEGFGLAVAEGMAFGKPVVGTATGGIMMQIWPGVNGFLVEPGNVKQLSEAILKILTDKKLSQKMGKKALQIFNSLFSLERGVRDNIELYEQVLGVEF